MPYFIYILQSKSTSQYYIGHTDNLARRISQHNDADYQGSKHTKRSKGPWTCVYTETYMTRSDAMQREKEIKAKKSRKYIDNLLNRQSPEGVRD
jgi:putative endonuclease